MKKTIELADKDFDLINQALKSMYNQNMKIVQENRDKISDAACGAILQSADSFALLQIKIEKQWMNSGQAGNTETTQK